MTVQKKEECVFGQGKREQRIPLLLCTHIQESHREGREQQII